MFIRLLISFLLCAGISTTLAQTSQPIPSQNNRFTFPESIVCVSYGANNEIVLTTTGLECPTGGPACAIDFNYDPAEGFGMKAGATAGTVEVDFANLTTFFDGVPIDFSFIEPGTYAIAVLIGQGAGNFDQLTQSVTVLAATPPQFNVYNCSSNEVQVEITDTAFPFYTVDYDQDNVADVQSPTGMVSPTHVYPGAQTQGIITVRPDYLGCTANTKTIPLINGPFTNDHFISRLQVAESDEIQLTFQNIDNNVLYSLERSTDGTSGFASIDEFSDIDSYTDTNVTPEQDFYCYRLAARDVCNNQTFYANTMCSHTIALDIQDGSNSIAWETSLAGAGGLTLMKNAQILTPGFTPAGLFNDSDIVCGTEYCYRMITDYGTSIQSVSRTICGTAESTQPPDAINEITTVVDGNSVKLDWVPDPDYTTPEYAVFRIPTNVALPYKRTTELTLTDDTYIPFEGICYQIRFDDVCGNRSTRSQEVCPIELKATLNNTDNSVTLEWNTYNGWISGVDHYVIEKYDSEGQLISSIDHTTNSFTDVNSATGQIFTYRVLAIPVSAVVPQPSVSNTQTIIKSPKLYHPTAFVPGSGIAENRTFSVKGIPEYISSYELRIFNRWGELMFHSQDMTQGWDGTFKGVLMPEGTYVFKTKITDTAGRDFDYSGAVVLFRK
jgi:gliding motility-associated-like protein